MEYMGSNLEAAAHQSWGWGGVDSDPPPIYQTRQILLPARSFTMNELMLQICFLCSRLQCCVNRVHKASAVTSTALIRC